jgi:hypothetical protein
MRRHDRLVIEVEFKPVAKTLIRIVLLRLTPKLSHTYCPLVSVAEFHFRYTSRGNADIFGTAIEGC